MKSSILTVFLSAVLTSISATPLDLPSALPSRSYLPDPRFTIRLELDATFLPINAAFLNILFFMGTISIHDITEQLAPRTYSAPGYQAVDIPSYAWTESRFLLWGIYLAVTNMVDNARFHNTQIELYWEDRLVGRIKIAAKNVLILPSGNDNMKNHADQRGRLNQGLSNRSDDLITINKGAVRTVQSVPKGNLTGGNSTADDIATVWNATDLRSLTAAASLTNNSPYTLPPFKVQFKPIAGASMIERNSVFLTFFAALLHIAQFRPDEELKTFRINSPVGKLYLQMDESDYTCLVMIFHSLFPLSRGRYMSMLTIFALPSMEEQLAF